MGHQVERGAGGQGGWPRSLARRAARGPKMSLAKRPRVLAPSALGIAEYTSVLHAWRAKQRRGSIDDIIGPMAKEPLCLSMCCFF